MKRKLIKLIKNILALLIGLALIEGISWLLIIGFFPDHDRYPFNRVVSGYTVFANTPGYCYQTSTIRSDESQPDLCIDSNGFVTSQPLQIEKKEGVFRIFLVGGSALFGSGQTRPYNTIKNYPAGVYSWNLSIAGQLMILLEQSCPNMKFEVVNAACSGYTTRQSLALYLEKIYSYHPDMVIEMSGMNDLIEIIASGPAHNLPDKFPSYADLYSRSRKLSRINTVKIIQLISMSVEDHNREKKTKEVSAQKLNYKKDLFVLDNYIKVKDFFIRSSENYLSLLRHNAAVFSADSVPYIFVLQPMLNRMLFNKQLTVTEIIFRDRIDPITSPEAELNACAALSRSHDGTFSNYDMAHLLLLFHFDAYLSHAMDSVMTNAGAVYLDANVQLAGKGQGKEFYTDYCHLTTAGNHVMAEMIAGEVVTLLKIQETPEP